MMMLDWQQFIENLPAVAEEGGFATMVTREQLMDALSSQAIVAEAQLSVIERLFVSLSLLDSELLQSGQWRFVSFSAALLARSVLQALGDDQSRLLPRDFWLPDQPETIVNEQRQLLHELETRRIDLHRQQSALPIRYVHVAWAFITLNGQLLLHHREDQSRRDVANFVPIGGKLHLCDFPETLAQVTALARMQAPADTEVFEVLPQTLMREVREETGLLQGEHYQFSEWKTLKPYRKVEGTGSRHAYTEYQIVIYQLQLNRSGFLKLAQRVQNSSALVWFSPVEVAQGFRSDGKTAFVDALRTGWHDHADELTKVLSTLPDSYNDELSKSAITKPVTLPRGDTPFLLGKTGQEKACHLVLTDEERLILLALGWHRRSLRWQPIEGLTAIAHGWVVAISDETDRLLANLTEKLTNQGLLLIECSDVNTYRLNTPDDTVYFDESLFELSIIMDETRIGVQITTLSIPTPIGTLQTLDVFIALSPKLTRELLQVAENTVYQVENPNLPGLLRREVEKTTQALGLRKLMRQDNGVYALTIQDVHKC
ncbi:MAG: hypothetical protein IBX56_11560 [Methylomicrobium sp.]|nr:hypothetical protein [Methylomicrobium sp.]